MRCRLPMTALALLAGLALFSGCSPEEKSSTTATRVLAEEVNGFNVAAVNSLLKKGDAASARGDLEEARRYYDKSRNASKQLLSFYRDISGSFRGLDARIPREMDQKGREAMKLLANTNLRLAALFRRMDQPEIAVPVLVEVVRLMTPVKPEGQKAYQSLLELGFVETPYSAAN